MKNLTSYNKVITYPYLADMIKSLITVGNSKALILPADMIRKYKLEKVVIEEVENGILIRSASDELTPFQKGMEDLRKNKAAIYKRMEAQAKDPETIRYYENPENNLSDVDPDFIEE